MDAGGLLAACIALLACMETIKETHKPRNRTDVTHGPRSHLTGQTMMDTSMAMMLPAAWLARRVVAATRGPYSNE